MNSNIVKPEKFGHLHLGYHFKIPLNISSIGVILTNASKSFQKSRVITTTLSDCHKVVLTFFKVHFSRLQPTTIFTEIINFLICKNFLMI